MPNLICIKREKRCYGARCLHRLAHEPVEIADDQCAFVKCSAPATCFIGNKSCRCTSVDSEDGKKLVLRAQREEAAAKKAAIKAKAAALQKRQEFEKKWDIKNAALKNKETKP